MHSHSLKHLATSYSHLPTHRFVFFDFHHYLHPAAICNWKCSFIQLNIRFTSSVSLSCLSHSYSYGTVFFIALHVDCAHCEISHFFFQLLQTFELFSFVCSRLHTFDVVNFYKAHTDTPHSGKLYHEKKPRIHIYFIYAENVCISLPLSWPYSLALIFEFHHQILDSCTFSYPSHTWNYFSLKWFPVKPLLEFISSKCVDNIRRSHSNHHMKYWNVALPEWI